MEDQQEEQEDLGQEEVEINDNNNNSSFSESLRLFQSLQVLANEDDGEALRNETTSSKYDGSHQSRPDFTSISRGPRGRGWLLLLLPDVQQRGGGGDPPDDHVRGLHHPPLHQAQEGEEGGQGDGGRCGSYTEVRQT